MGGARSTTKVLAVVLRREDALKTIADGLGRLEAACELRGALHLFDTNVLSHHLFCRMLNAMYGLSLEVMDRIQSNYPAIDLGDSKNRIAFQVTAEKSGVKVQHTLDGFAEHGLQAKFDKLRVLVIGKRQDRYTALSIPQEIAFDPDEDIVDFKGLLKDADALSTPLLEEVVAIFDEELHQSASHVQAHRDQPFCIATHHDTHESVSLVDCEWHGRPAVPICLESDPGRIGSDWLVERLLKASVLQLYRHPTWGGGTWFVADMAAGDGVVINLAQLAELRPVSPTTTTSTTTTAAPQDNRGSTKFGQTTTDEAVAFLKSRLRTLQGHYEALQHLCPQDLLPSDDAPPTTSEDEERCARLADQYGFDGNLFRNLLPLHPDRDGADFSLLLRRLCKRIETIPRIIAAIESPQTSG